MSFATLPQSAKKDLIVSFTVNIPQSRVDEMKALVRASRFPPATYETTESSSDFGITQQWMSQAREQWLTAFDWRDVEARMNSVPNFTASVELDSDTHTVHFAAIFSSSPDAIPIICYHGWPGSYIEFLPMLQNLSTKYNPTTLPFHIIVPSLPGYTFSSIPNNRNFTMLDAAQLHRAFITRTLGFPRYISHGGDVGSGLARILAATDPSCIGCHVNFMDLQPTTDDPTTLSASQKARLKKNRAFVSTGLGYAIMQGTKPATTSFILAAGPISLLAWIGEKMSAGLSPRPHLDPTTAILESVSLYWLTDTQPTSIWMYREFFGPSAGNNPPSLPPCEKPLGFSSFPDDVHYVPEQWARQRGDLVFFREHQAGGHFAAWEEPEAMWCDIEEFARIVLAKEDGKG